MSLLSRLRRNIEGAAALEFAIVAPLFFLVIFTMIGYGIYLSATHAIQQIAADAARTAVAGLSATERKSLANTFIQSSTLDYAFIDPDKLTIDVEDDVGNLNQFTVTIAYDSSELPIWKLFSFALPDDQIKRYATIRVGGI
ncbi:pilus assembly protein [Pararhizobium sp. BT-229]|uniref:TadE/TadG family type IV pilus assembly protein n=1 Tax=Pararhizobium sp. BT-229 TaxID=2986923 RepID=UPI0021F6DB1B|nr:TadE/TadG family type IV pilus assembly protein [Pararhizobium sp. BT-229]MCV9960620.1 pilus assembly protein [Pararhizobium sp. BT-229]